jgi:copper chaperone CopZ
MTGEVNQEKQPWTVNGRKLVILLFVWSFVLAGSIAGYTFVYAPRLKAAGDLANAETAVFAVEGMHCAGCAEAIVQELEQTEGVVSAEASFETGEATVKYVPSRITRLAMREAIGKLGYTATTKEFHK